MSTVAARESQLQEAIARLPRISLGWLNTPLESMPRLSAYLGGPPLYIKRDDLTGLAFGGNKTRMLEFSLADALAKGADTIVTGMAVQSNYCRQMAGACAKLGLDLHLLLRPEREVDKTQITGNNLIQRLLGANVTVLPDNDRARQQEAVAAKAAELTAAGRKVYIPRQEDTVDLDAIAYAEAALEITRQCREQEIEPVWLYTAAADTTQAGLVLAAKWLGSPFRIRGINPALGDDFEARMARMANQAAQRLGLDIDFTEDDFDNDRSFVGERYGVPTEAGLEAIRIVAQTEGILLDPVYTGKAMSGLFQHIVTGVIGPDEPVLFLHTGGAPAIFGYTEEVLRALA
jgi:1-aminocyclopropane-1-carboxylate deaminase/D-cysteine desulfhydrase-like pyridoxal-dependent ACC family enzyme